MMKYLMILNLLFLSILFLGCKDEDQALREQTQKASEGERLEEYATAGEREAFLYQKYRFYKALEGTYEGVVQTSLGQSKIHLELSLSYSPYPLGPNQTRTLDEVTEDINKLSMSVLVKQWNSSSEDSISEGCALESVSPQRDTGKINIVSQECQNQYYLFLSDATLIRAENLAEVTPKNTAQEKAHATELAKAVWEGQLETVSQLRGQTKSKNIPPNYEILVTRIQ
ncbi:MAG: hypothetical protein HYW85_02610 [Deltaproteobacteria bacterium]|nr:hypothetical protein [Deltaproteobacteria bacterium]